MNNHAVSEHIWNILVVQGDDNDAHSNIERDKTKQERIPLLHIDWLTPQDLDTRALQDIHKEVICRVNDLESAQNNEE